MENKGPDGTRSIPLVKSIRYESFQFHAISEPNFGITVEQLFLLEILHIYKWVINRCRETDLPDAFKNITSLDDFKNFTKEDIISFRHDIGYKLEVAYTDNKKTWAMQIVEPDRGPYPDKPELNRVVVPGRLFETNIGLKIIGNTVEIGTKTYVDEPIGTTAECGAFIQKFIKKFMIDKYITLKEDNIPISPKPLYIKSKDTLESLVKWLNNEKRQHLAVIYIEPDEVAIEKDEIINNQDENQKEDTNIISDVENEKLNLLNLTEEYINSFIYLADFFKGYAFFFYIPKDKRQKFIEKTGYNLDKKNLVLIEANKYKNEKYKKEDLLSSISDYRNNPEIKLAIDMKIEKSSEKREFDYKNIKYVPDIRNKTVSDLYDEIDKLENEKEKSKEENIRSQENFNKLLNNKDYKIDTLVNDIKEKDFEINKLKQILEEGKNVESVEISKYKAQIRDLEQQVKDLKEKKKRPRQFSDINAWIKDSFSGKLILSHKAKSNIKKENRLDIDEICDALEYLALDYLDYKQGKFNIDELKKRCLKKYYRSFDITPIDDTEKNSLYYTFIYGSKGKICCDEHLILNKKDAARIYFIYIKEDKRIVIGNLPSHAPEAQRK